MFYTLISLISGISLSGILAYVHTFRNVYIDATSFIVSFIIYYCIQLYIRDRLLRDLYSKEEDLEEEDLEEAICKYQDLIDIPGIGKISKERLIENYNINTPEQLIEKYKSDPENILEILTSINLSKNNQNKVIEAINI